MLVPQQIGTAGKVEIDMYVEDGGDVTTYEAGLTGLELVKGKTMVITLSKNAVTWTNTLEVPNAYVWRTNRAGSGNIEKVYSYKESSEGTVEAVPWTLKCSTDGGKNWGETLPDWLGLSKTSGSGSKNGEYIGFTIKTNAEMGSVDETHTLALQEAEEKGVSESAPWDLALGAVRFSTGMGPGSTANCYVVSAPGYYCFPLAYGNGVDSGGENSSAYTSTSSGSTVLTPFVNHAGNGITSGVIAGNGVTPQEAELLWQDAEDLITDVRISSSVGYEIGGVISFRVTQENIRQGNAVIAVKDAEGNVIWSWHIWVTDRDLSETVAVTNHDGTTYDFMPVPLGWVDPKVRDYYGRSCKLKFSAEGAEDQIMTFECPEGQIVTPGNAPYYEWGRKDPFMPAVYAGSSTTKTWYDADGTASTKSPSVSSEQAVGDRWIQLGILNPMMMIPSSYTGVGGTSSGDATYYNLWSANNTATGVNGNAVVKTIYDPCPAGYHVPPSNAFTGITTTGASTSTTSEINGVWNSDQYGFDFYTGKSTSSTILFPALGARAAGDGSITTGFGYYWTAMPSDNSKGQAYMTIFKNGGTVNPTSNSGARGRAFGIFPVAD